MSGARRGAALAAYGGAAAILAATLALAAEVGWAHERAIVATRGSGWGALAMLLLALSASPLASVAARLGHRLEVAPWRRAFGISAAALACVHASIVLASQLSGSLAPLVDIAWIRAGALALFVLLALWLTSYPRMTRALRLSHWKALHRLAYAAGLLALLHVLGAPFAPRALVLALVGAALVLGVARLLPRGKRPPKERDPQRRGGAPQAESQSES